MKIEDLEHDTNEDVPKSKVILKKENIDNKLNNVIKNNLNSCDPNNPEIWVGSVDDLWEDWDEYLLSQEKE